MNSSLQYFGVIILIAVVLFTGFAYSEPIDSTNINNNSLQEITLSQVEQLFHRDNNKTTPVEITHKPHCIHKAYQACYNNDIYWFDSCNKIEKIALKCGRSKPPLLEKYCKNGNVYQDKTETIVNCEQAVCLSLIMGEEVITQNCLGKGCTKGKCNLQQKPIRIFNPRNKQQIQ